MSSFLIDFKTIQVSLNTGPDMLDITHELEQVVQEVQIKDGILFLSMKGSTGSITAIEYEPGVIKDLKQAINRIAPPDVEYEHEKAWHDGNGHSHVQAAILGPCYHVPVRQGKIGLGIWQQVVAINHDNKPRTRSIEISVFGKKE